MKDFVCFYPATKLLTVEKCNKGPLFEENERKQFYNKLFHQEPKPQKSNTLFDEEN